MRMCASNACRSNVTCWLSCICTVAHTEPAARAEGAVAKMIASTAATSKDLEPFVVIAREGKRA